eukprot:1861719-Amphidinium_carterae.1
MEREARVIKRAQQQPNIQHVQQNEPRLIACSLDANSFSLCGCSTMTSHCGHYDLLRFDKTLTIGGIPLLAQGEGFVGITSD